MCSSHSQTWHSPSDWRDMGWLCVAVRMLMKLSLRLPDEMLQWGESSGPLPKAVPQLSKGGLQNVLTTPTPNDLLSPGGDELECKADIGHK